MATVTFPPIEHTSPPKSPFLRSVYQWGYPQDPSLLIRLPVYYYDNASMSAVYTADSARVRKLLPDPKMHLVEVLPGRCAISFNTFEYKKCDLGPYNELSIAFPITYGKRNLPMLSLGKMFLEQCFHGFVWHLPVTTERARWGGVELYGFPKFIADIEFTKSKNALSCALSEKGRHILTLSGPTLPVAQGKPYRFKTYSIKDGMPLCANVYTNPIKFAESILPKGVTLELGDDHPIANALRELDVSTRPLMYQYCPKNELVLFGPRNLMDD